MKQELNNLQQELISTKKKVYKLEKDIIELKKKPILDFFNRFSFKQRVFIIAGFLFFMAIAITAGTINKPHTFTDGTTILASQVNENFDIIFQLLNGNLTSENISGIDASKITSGTLDNARLSSTSSTSSSNSNRITLYEARKVTTSNNSIDFSRTYEMNINNCVAEKEDLNIPGEYTSIFVSKKNRPLKDLIPEDKKNLPVYSVSNTKISQTWNELWDGNIDVSLKDADVIHSGTSYFVSGTDQNGNPGNICEHNQGLGSSWSSNNSSRGYVEVGSVHSTTSEWIDYPQTYYCESRISYLCISY